MKKFFLWFVPHERNNHRARLLQPMALMVMVAFYLLNQSLIRSFATLRPGVLGYSTEITVEKVLNQTNKERQDNGLAPLKFNSVLSKSAAAKARDMFADNYWAHNSPDGTTPWEFFKDAGYEYSIAGENLARDFYDTESLMKAWMKSPTHRANIVHQKYQEIGIGVVNGTLNGVETTLVVQHFGTPLSGVIENPEITQLPETANVNGVLEQNAHLISPLTISKTVGSVMFIIIIGVLFIDGYIALNSRTRRLTGSNTGHIGFLVFILLLMLFSRQGVIF